MYGLATHYQLLLGDTIVVSNKICRHSWTSSKARDKVDDLIGKWNRINFGCIDPVSGINICKSYLNEMLSALEKEMNANNGWAVGHGLLSLANSLCNSTVNQVASKLSEIASEYCSDQADSVETLMNEVKYILNKY